MEDNVNVEAKKKKKSPLLIVLNRHKVSLLLIVFLMLVSTTFSWFIYNRTVSLGVESKVKAWNVSFDNVPDADSFKFYLPDMYPGMANATDQVSITNGGEIDAKVSIEIKSIKLFGVLQNLGRDYTIVTENQGKTIKVNKYPFLIELILSGDSLAVGKSTTLGINVVWPYETTGPQCVVGPDGVNSCDILDTLYGDKSYQFYKDPANKGKPSLEIDVKVSVDQVQ